MAVLLVALHHVWLGRVSGGVDVFLMLSSFFIVGGLLRGFQRNDPVRLREYLPRLFRRLVPALAVVVAAVLVATVATLPVSGWAENARQAIVSLLYGENWYLAGSQQAYGAAAASQSPLQHIWSMSVQGQLYLAIPVLLLIVWWSSRPLGQTLRYRMLVSVLAALALLSFAYACWRVAIDQESAYYDTFARTWEYLVGVFVALLLARWRPGALLASLMGWVGIALLIATAWLVDGAAQFPGVAALVPIGAGALVVLAGPDARGGVNRLLAARPVARLGRYAYAFYLWHWPVLVFAIVVRGHEGIGLLAGLGVLGLSAALAWATHHLVEEPIRRARPIERGMPGRRRRWIASAAVLAVLLAVPAAWTARVDLMRTQALSAAGAADLAQYPGALSVLRADAFADDAGAVPIPAVEVAADDKVRAVFDGCGTDGSEIVACSYGDLDADRVLAVVGGSHTEHWIDLLADLGERHGFRVDTMIRWSCELMDGAEGTPFGEDAGCLAWAEAVMQRLLEERPDAVFTTASRPDVTGASREAVPESYVRAWDRLAAAGIPSIGIRDIPWTPADPVDCVARHVGDVSGCGVARSDVLDEISPLDGRADPLVSYLDLNDVICPEGWCPFVQGGRIVYRDPSHLTATYTRSLESVFEERLRPLLGWW